AVLPVVLFHFGISAIPGGFSGVDIFFVISGYLISGSLLDDLERGQFSIVNFYWRRARRILPALVFVMLLTCIAALFILLPSDLREFGLSIIAASTFWSNVFFWKTSSYFSIDAALRPLLHTWSLSVEEQYYIFAPILMFLIYRYIGKRWLTTLLPIILCSFVMAAGFGLLAIGFFALSESDPFPGYNALYPCIGTALLIYVGQNSPSTVASRMLEVRPLVWIGLISYSLYLVHWPLNAFAHYLSFQKLDPLMTGAMLVASLALAAFSWKFVEQPFRQKRAFTAPGPIFAFSALAIVVLCAGGAAGALGNGFPQRFPDYVQRRISVGDWRNGICFNEGTSRIESWNMEDCTRTRGFPTTVFLWGDSFAAHYVSGLGANINRLQANIVEYTYAGCPPILSYYSYARLDCVRFNRKALDIILEADIKTVILSGKWSDYEVRGFDGLQQTIDTLRALGVRVFVIGQSPQFPTDVRKIAFFAKRQNLDDTSWPMAMDPGINERVRSFTKGATFIDPLKFLCSAGRCPYSDRGEFMYFDYGHFSSAGATLAISKYWPAFGKDNALPKTK
ncbi:MAG: acyltransferase, partial [Mesorhizobium sp.]